MATVVVHGGEPELAQMLRACGVDVRVADSPQALVENVHLWAPDAVVLELDEEDTTTLGEVAARLPRQTRLIAIGDPAATMQAANTAAPDCVVFSPCDESTLCGALEVGAPVVPDVLLRELVTMSVFGLDLQATLRELTHRLARAFDADDCVIVLPEEGLAFSARSLPDAVLGDLAVLCEKVCQFATTVIAPPRPGRPYRAFLGLSLSHDNAPPSALVLLCREMPSPFSRGALGFLRALGLRLSVDLSWRMVHERLLADRDRLRDLSRIDPVLGVANRTALQEELANRIAPTERRGEPFSVALIDVDGLRLINERHGYPAGDAVLGHVAQVARMKIRPADFVARYAGDTVALALPGLGASAAIETLTSILSAFDAQPVVHEEKTINVTVSAGIAEVRYGDDTGEAALGRAMAARERARRTGEVIAVADDETTVEAPAQVDFAIGTTLGGVYQIRHEISRGAFGVVYRAEDLALGRQVALKLLRPDLARDTALVEQFRSEAATLARIRNPNLVQVYAFGLDGANVYFAMELVEGQGLEEHISSARRRRRHLPLPEVVSIIEQIGGALEAVHRAGMLHRDVKPENVLRDRINKRFVLVDVGIAVRRGEKHAAGTPGFTAPEVFGLANETPATDVYSLGALAYLLLTMQPPFGDASPYVLLHLQSTQLPPPPTQLRRDLPAGVNSILLPALDPDPRKRPQSAAKFARSLADALARTDTTALRQRPRNTMEPAAKRASLTRMPSLSFKNVAPTVASTRGILFRSAFEVLGARKGAAWMANVSQELPALAGALGPQSSPLAWHPTDAFIDVLKALSDDPQEARALASSLGKSAVDASFGQFYGADPSALRPTQVLQATDIFWRSYHSWGSASVTARDHDAEITVAHAVPSAILCASTAGLLAGVVARAGGESVQVEHPACVGEGSRDCVFRLGWR